MRKKTPIESEKTPIEIEGVEERTILTLPDLAGTLKFVYVPDDLAVAAEFARARDIRRTWDVACNAAAFDIYDVHPAERVQLTVSNKGDCPFKLTFTKDDGATQDFTIPAGTPRTITRSAIEKITVACNGLAANKCKASYTLTEL